MPQPKRLGIQLDASPERVLIAEVMPGGPAATAGIRKGDLLLEVDGKSVADMSEMELKRALRPDGPLDLKVRRGGETLVLRVAPS